jgi:hypothetical protein
MPGYFGLDERDWLMQGSPTGTFFENFPNEGATTDLVASLLTAVMTSVAMPLVQGATVSNISYLIGATALVTPQHSWVALYSPAGALLAQSADITAAVAAANTVKTVTLTTPQYINATGVFFAAIMYAASGTIPTLVGRVSGLNATGQAALNTAFTMPNDSQTSGSALTTTAPATIATPTVIMPTPYVVCT